MYKLHALKTWNFYQCAKSNFYMLSGKRGKEHARVSEGIRWCYWLLNTIHSLTSLVWHSFLPLSLCIECLTSSIWHILKITEVSACQRRKDRFNPLQPLLVLMAAPPPSTESTELVDKAIVCLIAKLILQLFARCFMTLGQIRTKEFHCDNPCVQLIYNPNVQPLGIWILK